MLKKSLVVCLILLVGCSQSFYTQGKRLVDQGQYDQAIDAFYKEIQANPKSALAWRELGTAYYKKGNLTKAEDAFKQSNHIQPDPLANLYIGMIFEQQEKFDTAIDAYTAALNLQPKGKTKSLIRAHLDRLISGRIKKEAVLAIENEAKVKAESLPLNTIAVVNFDGSHLPPDMAPIAGGLAEFTSMDLTKVKMLRVVDRLKIDAIQNELKLSSSVYADPTYAPKLGRMLGSHNVITGTLLSIGDNGLRLDGIIVNTVDASTRQTTPTEGEVNGFFKIQKAFVFKIIDDMGITLSPEERDAIQKIPTESYLAFMAYCRGLDYKNRGLDQEARQAFNQAAQTDKTFKEAATQSRELSASAGVKGEASNFERFESSVETETAKEQTATGLDQKLSDVVNNAGVIPDLSHPGTVLAQPVIGSTGPVIIKGDLDGN